MTIQNLLFKPEIAIVGAGAIGQLMFHQLSPYTHPLLLLNHQPSDELVTLDFEDQNGAFSQQQARCAHSQHTNAAQLAGLKLVIVCVKAYQVADAIRPLLTTLPKHCHLLLLHNGMGPHIEVQQLLTEQQRTDIGLSIGTTSQAALKVSRFAIKQTGAGKTVIGQVTGTPCHQTVMSLLQQAITPLNVTQDIVAALWHKLVINCAINPLTAIEQCTNGQLAKQHYQDAITAIVTECCQVAKADGVELVVNDMLALVADVIALTADNYSSMRQDVHFERKTEIDYINGYVVARAKVHGIDAPANQKMRSKITRISALQAQ